MLLRKQYDPDEIHPAGASAVWRFAACICLHDPRGRSQNDNMALRPQATALRQPTLLRQPMALLEDMPVELTVALLARRIALRPMALLLRPMAVISLTPLGRDRRPMTWRGPATETPRTSGTPLPARTDAATCASRIPIPCAVMDTKRRARPPKNERRPPLILSPARPRGF